MAIQIKTIPVLTDKDTERFMALAESNNREIPSDDEIAQIAFVPVCKTMITQHLQSASDPKNTTPEEYIKLLKEIHTDITLRLAAMGVDKTDDEERNTGRITVSFFRKVYKQFIDERISMTKMLEMLTEQAQRTDVCDKCQRPLDGTNISKTKCNSCFAVNA